MEKIHCRDAWCFYMSLIAIIHQVAKKYFFEESYVLFTFSLSQTKLKKTRIYIDLEQKAGKITILII